MKPGVVIAGAGQAGLQAAVSLREAGFDGPVTLIGDEPCLPYQRPPLSKGYLTGKQAADSLPLRPESTYVAHGIDVILSDAVADIDRGNGTVGLASGARLAFAHLVLATGARIRPLTVAGAALDGVHYLRSLSDSDALRARLAHARAVSIIGGGFIGLEVAASARLLGRRVTIIEALPRLMSRAVGPEISDFFADLHRRHGVTVRLGTAVAHLRGEGGAVCGVVTAAGEDIPADLVVVGIGVLPNDAIARACGLAVADGVVVDETLLSADARISAIGDCAAFPSRHAGVRLRLESVQNAVDQGRAVAAALCGRAAPYAALPWFWTDQYDVKLQMAGLSAGFTHTVVHGDVQAGRFSVLYFRGDRLIAVDAVNRPGDYMSARRLLAAGAVVTPEDAARADFDLKAAARFRA